MAATWEEYVEEQSSPIEDKFLDGEKFNDRLLLIRALTRNAKLNEALEFHEMKANGSQIGLDTIGDTVLDFVIIDHFSQESRETSKARYSPEQLNKFREIYGTNPHLHDFSKNVIGLQQYVIWGNDEEDKKKWAENSTDLLADCFEALLGAIYLDKGIDGVKKFMKNVMFFDYMDKITKA